jgi:hypothetical protein
VQVLVAIDGCGVLEAPGKLPVTFAKGECVVVPAACSEFNVRPQWAVEFVRATLPAVTVPQPQLMPEQAV